MEGTESTDKKTPIDVQLRELAEAVQVAKSEIIEALHKKVDEIKKLLTSEEW